MGVSVTKSVYSVSRLKKVWSEIKDYMINEKSYYVRLSTIEKRVPKIEGQKLSANDKMVICSIVQRENQFEITHEAGGAKIIHYLGESDNE
ncbi:hypothetical protein [Latilactobacillus graminis]|uniref:hypothetical protein n=1 Tax=Latilactobacillus graminis TaxID=60519 RepID=UPI00070AF2B4|nr:hypothetical protein [Latilactobacillus graminis]